MKFISRALGRLKRNKIIALLTASASHWSSHNASRLGAALSYYTIFSLAPLTVLVIALVSLFADHATVQSALLGQVGGVIGEQGRGFIESILVASSKPSAGIIAAIVSFVTLIVGAIGVFSELQSSMNDFWNAPKKAPAEKGIFHALRERLLTLSLIPVLVFLLLISLVFTTLLNAFAHYISSVGDLSILFNLIDIVFSVVVVTILFAFIYHFLPNVKLPWKETLPGAAITSILFAVGKFLIGFYLAETVSIATFGTATALVVIMVWTYYSIQIFLFGASITYTYSRKYGYLRGN